MILVDTSIWIDHLRQFNEYLADLLERDLVLMHPFVLGELALGSIKDQRRTIARLSKLRVAAVASPAEVLTLIDKRQLHGTGIGYVDAHLLAAIYTSSAAGLQLWTRDRRLRAVAERLEIAWSGPRLQ
jgi:predicted nucleic acid-binding protein